MCLSVLNLSAAILALGSVDGQQISARERQAWTRISPSVAYVLRDDQTIGCAALVDARGFFLAHSSVATGKRIFAKLSDGQRIELQLKSSDAPTQLALLEALDWTHRMPVLRSLGKELASGERLLAVLPTGVIRAQLVGGKRVGVMAPSQQLMPLNEIRFEAPADKVGGALVLTMDGRIAGFLNATLHEEVVSESARMARGQMDDAAPAAKGVQNLFGPADMTVAFTVAPSALKKVVDQMLVGSSSVNRPTIGVTAKDAPGGGALIERIAPNSAASEAGLRSGDVILEIDRDKVSNQFEMALIVMRHQVGDSLRIKVRRNRTIMTFALKIRAQRSGNNPVSPTE